MARRYCTFLVRHLSLGDGGERKEIACIPTGEKVLVGSLAEALGWITFRVGGAAGAADMSRDAYGRDTDPDGAHIQHAIEDEPAREHAIVTSRGGGSDGRVLKAPA